MSKRKPNYTESANKMLARGTEFAKEGKVVEKQVEFAKAYAKLARTPESCTGWINALTAANADPAVSAPFIAKKAELEAASPVQQVAMDEMIHEDKHEEGEVVPTEESAPAEEADRDNEE